MSRIFRTVLIDPPWPERGAGRIKRGADRHYPVLRVGEIAPTILSCPYWSDVGTPSHLYLWSTNNHLPQAIELVDTLGFRYITNLAWAKLCPDHEAARVMRARGVVADNLEQACAGKGHRHSAGLGQYFVGQHELLLFAVRGNGFNGTVRSAAKCPPTLIVEDRSEHSRKPEGAYAVIEARSKGRYLELFARRQRRGWTSWGNEISVGRLRGGVARRRM